MVFFQGKAFDKARRYKQHSYLKTGHQRCLQLTAQQLRTSKLIYERPSREDPFRKETIPPSSLRVQRPSYFATEGAGILGVLADFNFLHHFPEGGTITGPVFAHDSDLLGAFSLLRMS